MITFLPYPDFRECALCLDKKRLGKQRIEAYDILKQNVYNYNPPKIPIYKMWKGYDEALICYGIQICQVWRDYGYADTFLEKFHSLSKADKILTQEDLKKLNLLPSWLGNNDLHASHRATLLAKKKDFYKQFGWTET